MLKWTVTGGSAPPLLSLHGSRQTHQMWRQLASRFAAEFTARARPARLSR
jgi:hypothetical protein